MPDKIITELQTVACEGGFAGVGGMLLHYLLKALVLVEKCPFLTNGGDFLAVLYQGGFVCVT